MSSYKAPRVDGFQLICLETYWEVVAIDVWTMVSNAFSIGTFDPGLVETLIVPIPKIDAPKSFKDLCPIILCNVLLKVITKVMVNRIHPHLGKLIDPLQKKFIPKKGTSNNALISKEMVHHIHKKKGKRGQVMFKIDFEKANDRVDWNFLRLTLN